MRFRQLTFSAILLFFSSFVIAGDRAPALVVFGDSLSDMGNLNRFTQLLGVEPAIPPSKEPYETFWLGRFSNGPIWAEYLADHMFVDLKASIDARAWQVPEGINFSWGGATSDVSNPTPAGLPVPGLLGQIDLYKLRFDRVNGTAPDTLFAIWVGADDFLLNPSVEVDPQVVVGNIVKGIRKLRRLGARQILVANLPELCALPTPEGQPVLAGCVPGQLTPAQRFNAALASKLQKLADKWHNTDIYLVNIYTAAAPVFGVLGTDPGPAENCLFSLPGDPSPCLDLSDDFEESPLGSCDLLNPPATYIDHALWDEQHPTTFVHCLINNEVENALMMSL